MPPRIRTRASKALKENIDVTGKKLKSVKNNIKAPRKALADKTNSASDDASLEIPQKSKKTITSKAGPKQSDEKRENVETKLKQNVETQQKQNSKLKQNIQLKKNTEHINDVRPRRDRRLPTRYVENPLLKNLSNGKDSRNVIHNNSETNPNPKADNTPAKNESPTENKKPKSSPFKTPAKADSSLLVSRPSRICRLPSRLEDHFLSPNKYLPIQPANASTPIQQNKTKLLAPLNDKENIQNILVKNVEKKQVPKRPTRLPKIDDLQKKGSSDNASDKSSPDSNNNAKGRSTRRKAIKTQPSVNKKESPIKKNQSPIRKFLTPMNKNQSSVEKIQSRSRTQSPVKKMYPKQSTNKIQNLSFKLLGNKKKSQESDNNENLDVYEFTFDPDEEPKPLKKKRKKTVTKKPTTKPQSKKVVYKSSYDQNISKALAALKNAVKPGKIAKGHKLTQITENSDEVPENVEQTNVANNVNTVQNTNIIKENNIALNDTGKNSVHECNYPSIRVEDIAADIEPSMDHHDDINYSPVNSPRPNGSMTPIASVNLRESPKRPVHNNDPLSLQEELSFFDDQPVASSSMNMSVRHPLASPWRVEFGSLPIKWPVNTYVKANMTPAVDSSFISSEDTIKKKHVYTNMLPQTHDMFTENDNETPNLKQTSIISFIREIAEKSAKKRQGRSISPTKAVYEEIVDTNTQTTKNKKSTKKATNNKSTTSSNNTSEEVSSSVNDTSNEKENSKEERITRKRKNFENICDIPAKSPRKQDDKDCTYFGFDELENLDSENVSPIKINNNPKGRSLRPRAVLQEVNGPTRAVLPAKTKIAASSEAVNKVYEELKSAADAPLFPENNVDNNATNIEDPLSNDDSESVHLFEDIEVVHHGKPTRKSYGKAKKVTFLQRTNSDSDTQERIVANHNGSSDYDDLGDLTFEIPNVKKKKTMKKDKPNKKLRTKKEEIEAEAWAVGFNSMCEDIEDFPLVVE